ncbi:MAG: DUF1573 domain-containing protein [Bacteroidales bacterium]|nr:DUF1573 domain-containing protein [Bacteroidales bacterium]
MVFGGLFAAAQTVIENKLSFDSTVYNFGDIISGTGEVSCTFTFKNISDKPVAVYTVNSSCGCTIPSWSKDPILPGKTGQIKAVYKNDEGPVTFDKILSCYISGLDKPVKLHVKGTCYSKAVSLEDRYPILIKGTDGKTVAGFKKDAFTLGTVALGKEAQEEIEVANPGRKTVKIAFENVSEGLVIEPVEVASGKVAVVSVVQKPVEGLWGSNTYYATPVVLDSKGKTISKGTPLSFTFFTIEDFSDYTTAQKVQAPKPMFDKSTVFAGNLKSSSKPVDVVFKFTNSSNKPLVIHKVDCPEGVVCKSFPAETKGSGKGTMTFTFDPSKAGEGEVSLMISLTTNSPSRPVVNLFIAAIIK